MTAPEVRPLTSCFWVSHPTITGTIIARLVNAESSAQNCPREVCSAATESGCHSMDVNETLNRNSFQPKITHNIAVEAMPARVRGISMRNSIWVRFSPSTSAASSMPRGRSFMNWYIIHTTKQQLGRQFVGGRVGLEAREYQPEDGTEEHDHGTPERHVLQNVLITDENTAEEMVGILDVSYGRVDEATISWALGRLA